MARRDGTDYIFHLAKTSAYSSFLCVNATFHLTIIHTTAEHAVVFSYLAILFFQHDTENKQARSSYVKLFRLKDITQLITQNTYSTEQCSCGALSSVRGWFTHPTGSFLPDSRVGQDAMLFLKAIQRSFHYFSIDHFRAQEVL